MSHHNSDYNIRSIISIAIAGSAGYCRTGLRYLTTHSAVALVATGLTLWSPPVIAKSIQMSAQQQTYVKRAEQFLNGYDFLEGRFEQTNSDQTKKDGTFYMRRDGRLRFSYDDPDTTAVISNGSQVGVVNKKNQKPESPLVPISLTPLSMLTDNPADLMAKADVIAIDDKHSNYVAITLTEKDQRDQGSMQLYFRKPGFDLIGWIIREPNGTPTIVKVSDVVKNKKSDPRLFVIQQYD